MNQCGEVKNIEKIYKITSNILSYLNGKESHLDVKSSAIMEFTKNHKKKIYLEYINRGLYNKLVSIYKKNQSSEGNKIEFIDHLGVFKNKNLFIDKDSIANFCFSIICQILEAVSDIKDGLDGAGTQNEILNMIKTGQIAGVIAIPVIIIDTLINYFF